MPDLSVAEARRIHLSAQGFGRARTTGTLGKLRALSARLNAFQIDSVNVLVRAHYMPAFSRLGPYDMGHLDALAYERRELFEFWGHAACLLPMSLYPTFRWRMAEAEDSRWYAQLSRDQRGYIGAVLEEVAERGPIAASELRDGGKAKGPWWGWSDGKRALEVLFRLGRVVVADRRRFERRYDVPERVIPASVLAEPVPGPDDARKRLLEVAAKAHGVGTAADIAGYFHIENWYDRETATGKRRSELPRLFSEMVDEGRLDRVRVEGWKDFAYVVPGTRVPREVRARALISPFDPVMWERKPTQRLFGFEYKIEIYVPEPKRVYGYYCLPFLLADRFVARVDLKADRKARVLRVPGAFAEPGVDGDHVALELAEELRLLASWLGLDRIEMGRKGDLVRPLRRALAASWPV